MNQFVQWDPAHVRSVFPDLGGDGSGYRYGGSATDIRRAVADSTLHHPVMAHPEIRLIASGSPHLRPAYRRIILELAVARDSIARGYPSVGIHRAATRGEF
ncbi:MAG: hypothetical protein C7B45_16060 [Sulfobacillus acidophilus]|uniref:Uncharacterized protein n=1 Tax=Sulfobacillus acidophilus TaxID=53633 RepID=A0A2T2WDA6_9FIRM|nr:MAG: hypothetical protein C7B45_16060 [Sulfobacillus acidophilus]